MVASAHIITVPFIIITHSRYTHGTIIMNILHYSCVFYFSFITKSAARFIFVHEKDSHVYVLINSLFRKRKRKRKAVSLWSLSEFGDDSLRFHTILPSNFLKFWKNIESFFITSCTFICLIKIFFYFSMANNKYRQSISKYKA